jgi:hypothetical protein
LLPARSIAEEPSAAYIFPPGGQRGTKVSFVVGGHYFHGEAGFTMYGPGVQASQRIQEVPTRWFEGPLIPQPASQAAENYPRDHAGQVEIAADAPLGPRWWRVWTSQGVTPALMFIVGELPEFVEEEIDGDPLPVPVTLPLTINGRIFPREDVDLWAFSARRGQVVRCEVLAGRIGSGLDSHLEIIGPDNRRLLENGDCLGADSCLAFVAPVDGTYQARLYDSAFGGLQHYVYRLTITTGPCVESVYPLGGRRGSTLELHLLGKGLPGTPLAVPLPADGESPWEHPLRFDGHSTNPFTLELSDLPEAVEAEPNDTPQSNQAPVPGVVNGRIDRPGDVDCWSFPATGGQALDLEIRAARLGSPLDSVLTVLDTQGNELARSDDTPEQTDSQLRFTAPTAGTFVACVRERFGSRGGPQFGYRLQITPPPNLPPGFRLRLAADAVTIVREKEAKVRIDAERLGGFSGPIRVDFPNLPPGVTASGNEIAAGQNSVQVTLKADKTARIGVAEVPVVGRGEVVSTAGGASQELTHRAVLQPPRDPASERLAISVAMPTPFTFRSTYLQVYAGQGTTQRKRYLIERNGYAGPLEVRLADKQARHLQGVTGPTIVVPPEANEFVYPVQLPPWLEVGRTSRTTLVAIGEIEDFDGTRHKVSFNSQNQNEQLVFQADPAPLRLAAEPSISARPNAVIDVRVSVERSRSVPYPITLTLQTPAHIRGVSAEPVVVPADQKNALLRIALGEHIGPFNMPLTIRATARVGEDTFLAETKLQVAAEE